MPGRAPSSRAPTTTTESGRMCRIIPLASRWYDADFVPHAGRVTEKEGDAMAQTLAIGTDALRRDGPEKLTGRARYTGDLRFPGMLYARLVPSAYAAGRIKSIDTEA